MPPELKQQIKDIFLEIIGEDEAIPDFNKRNYLKLSQDEFNGGPEQRNQFRAELRQKVEEL